MVHIYNEITIYFYKAIFSSGASPSNPRWGPRLPSDPPAWGMDPSDPTEGVPPLCTHARGRVYIILGCKYFMGYKHGLKQRPLNQEDNQAPQPTISHLETDLKNSITAVYVGI
jgi:hypothetical protein